MPPFVFSSPSMRRMTTRSCNGRNFMDFRSRLTLRCRPRRNALALGSGFKRALIAAASTRYKRVPNSRGGWSLAFAPPPWFASAADGAASNQPRVAEAEVVASLSRICYGWQRATSMRRVFLLATDARAYFQRLGIVAAETA